MPASPVWKVPWIGVREETVGEANEYKDDDYRDHYEMDVEGKKKKEKLHINLM